MFLLQLINFITRSWAIFNFQEVNTGQLHVDIHSKSAGKV